MKQILQLLFKAAKEVLWPLIKKTIKAFVAKFFLGFFKKTAMFVLTLALVAVVIIVLLYLI